VAIRAARLPGEGSFVELRGRTWLVGEVREGDGLTSLRLSCTADDAQGEPLQVIWDAELGARRLGEDDSSTGGRGAPDDPAVLAAHLRAVRWRSASAADRELLQAPFRAGIRLDVYQLLPLRKALKRSDASDSPAPGDKVPDYDDDGDDEQEVDQAAGDMKAEPEEPKQNEQSSEP